LLILIQPIRFSSEEGDEGKGKEVVRETNRDSQMMANHDVWLLQIIVLLDFVRAGENYHGQMQRFLEPELSTEDFYRRKWGTKRAILQHATCHCPF
jgi:hypothetical protein